MSAVFRPKYEPTAQVIHVDGSTVVVRMLKDRQVRRVALEDLRHPKGSWWIANGANVEVALGALDMPGPVS